MSELTVLCQTRWNTGCHYSAEGQRIHAALIRTGSYPDLIYFNDQDRHIDGIIPVYSQQFLTTATGGFDTERMQEYVMYQYLRNQYGYSLYTSKGDITSMQCRELLREVNA